MKHYSIKTYLSSPETPPVWVEHVGRRTKPEEPHTHDCMEIMYIRSGAACCSINDRHYPVLRGDFYVFAPGDRHEFSISGGLSHDTLLFSLELFQEDEKQILLQNPVFQHWCTPGDISGKKLSFPLTAAAALDEMFDELSMDELQASILEIKKKQRERKFKECKRRVLEKNKEALIDLSDR